ncbi:MAG: hypothetical protein LBC98_04280 [Prevotellaceae bacterium]|jgi:hypothetical protein|nr:hypothetical protein [Prevotellaceae bacterium]
MKKFLYAAAILFSAITFSACEGPVGPMGPEGPPRETINRTITVGVNQWQLVGTPDQIGSYYHAVFSNVVPPYIFEKGVIVVYIALPKDGGVDVFTPLPYTIYGIATDDQNNEFPYSILYTYDVGSDGSMAIKMFVSDYLTSTITLSPQTFYVTML